MAPEARHGGSPAAQASRGPARSDAAQLSPGGKPLALARRGPGAVRDAPLGMRFGPQTQAPSRSPLGGSPASPTTPSDAGSSDVLLGPSP